MAIPISHKNLIILFIIGLISLAWANFREGVENQKKADNKKASNNSK